ncbi:aldehyde dehydrogenase family protein [Amycolatopsis sp. K13G38]|uniref:Aldehyde dehydrogenase family protein n=1 Tax=Amycolatopsis acididurans TaxID=2724524 RepID=A0ABX1J015_9PSEU|nr:aldehyde dehydrogenase family protein [Amycolatopsis acididurans]NKQ53091.1 aldehyde dehydrogenase family protein [Amycolatopsis acididurans]
MKQFIGGRWVAAGGGREFDDLDPWSGAVLDRVPAGDAHDARLAIEAAHAAFAGWKNTAPGVRQEIFLRAADILRRRRDEVMSWLAAETGCGYAFGSIQLDFVISLLRQASGAAYAAIGQVIPSDEPDAFAMALRHPVGVVAAIAPWNAALVLSCRAVAAPLALGNTVVLKPSEESPWAGGLVWAEIFTEAGLPPGVLNVVTHARGEAGVIGQELVAHPWVRRLNFTGSTVTGRRLAEAAGRHLKRMVLELGGQNPLIILADADVDYAVDAAAYGSFLHQGQICMCARRIFVERPIAARFLEQFAAKTAALPYGDPKDSATVVGPLINDYALRTVERRVGEAVASGARVLAGGSARGPCYPATLVVDVPPSCELARLETFGPVVMADIVDGPEEALQLANQSHYGLTAGVLTGDPERGLALANRLEAGIVHVNDQPIRDEPQMPFGGVKDSGWGRFGVGFAMEEFTEMRWVTLAGQRRSFPF